VKWRAQTSTVEFVILDEFDDVREPVAVVDIVLALLKFDVIVTQIITVTTSTNQHHQTLLSSAYQ
jgi:hypothetical protein